MRHRKAKSKLGSTSSHQRCLFANQLKSLITAERIVTTLPKARQLKRYADKMVTLAKKNDLASKKSAKAKLMVRYNPLTPKEARAAKAGDLSAYNDDRNVINKLFNVIAPRFSKRNGGYTRITKGKNRIGDNTQVCVVEYLSD